ncbi:DMT family transporter [Photobacterium leiognathi]|uniref:DMT family transporter n=1 Tax=Photobacterium leiognathi TaxID=553611 RepID=UPI00273A54BE|nr:multidrug efflux SMR transporter [Photobacterium leiognathi]
MSWLFLLLGVLAEATSHVALKSANGFTNPLPTAVVILGHITAFLFLSQAMKSIPVGIVHASWAGLAIILVTTLSSVIYNQHIDTKVWIGMIIVAVGLAVMNLSGAVHHH